MSPEPAETRREALAILVVVAGLATVVASPLLLRRFSAHPSEPTCRALLARYGELTARTLGETLDGPAREAAEDRLREQALAPESVARCTRAVSLEAAACAMAAPTADEVERCLQ